MKKKLFKFITNLNDTILSVVFVTIIVFSIIVVESIQLRPTEKQSVLGINSQSNFFSSSIDNTNKLYKISYSENDFQLTFKIEIDANGTEEIIIPLGRINSKVIKQGSIYRSVINVPEVYKNDINVLLLINQKPYGLLLNGVFYQNDFRSLDDDNSLISLKIITKNPIYYKIASDLIIYK